MENRCQSDSGLVDEVFCEWDESKTESEEKSRHCVQELLASTGCRFWKDNDNCLPGLNVNKAGETQYKGADLARTEELAVLTLLSS